MKIKWLFTAQGSAANSWRGQKIKGKNCVHDIKNG
jgi:hypothetical protein